VKAFAIVLLLSAMVHFDTPYLFLNIGPIRHPCGSLHMSNLDRFGDYGLCQEDGRGKFREDEAAGCSRDGWQLKPSKK
jgi:hypothetical protein